MAHHDPQLWQRHKERKRRDVERPQRREMAALREQRQRVRALRERMRGSEESESRA